MPLQTIRERIEEILPEILSAHGNEIELSVLILEIGGRLNLGPRDVILTLAEIHLSDKLEIQVYPRTASKTSATPSGASLLTTPYYGPRG